MEYGIYILTITAALTCPWWVSVPFMILSLGFARGAPVAVFAAIVMDSLYGTGIHSLYNVSFLYTAIFGTLAYMTIYLRRRVID